MERKDFYSDIKHLHKVIVAEIVALMVEHDVKEVDLLGSDADHAYVMGYAGDGSDVMSMEVSKVYLKEGTIELDVILDIDTEELAASNENGDIGDAYQCWKAVDFEHFIACAGIELVYDSVWQVLSKQGTKRFEVATEPKELNFYSIDESNDGGKEIHISGYTYKGDDHWECTDVCWFIEPLAEFIQHVKENENYVDEQMSEYKQYIKDCTAEELTDIINHYFNGERADYYLPFGEITLDTPCGNYVC